MGRVAAEQRRTELIDATIKIAVAEGLEAATVRRIAKEAGVPLGTVHYCFGSKAALIAAVAESIEQPDLGAEDLGRLPADQAILAAFREYWRQVGSDRRRQLLIYELVAHLSRGGSEARPIAQQLMQRAYGAVLGALETYAAANGRAMPDDAMLLARGIVALTDGVSLSWIVDDDDESANRILEVVALMIGGTVDFLMPKIEAPDQAGRTETTEPPA
ncbi:TetR/AcrR family transcriptional regulator [Flexivirga meconopsidis]|uniref:TetR/AcrR family transcriptional regulator n=1 Tax=Flexivirga meconopsidis TaxID=2977121 RepID=UPI00223FFD0B|nr:TetR/AcrR family transcriptional regulator [Flexivirga meconopsidis]